MHTTFLTDLAAALVPLFEAHPLGAALFILLLFVWIRPRR